MSPGKIDRNPKKATPPEMIDMLSAWFSAQARLRICFHPDHGMVVGFSAVTPGSCARSGMSAGSSSARSPDAAALAAAARRAAFSSTRCRIRSTALSCCVVPAIVCSSFSRPARPRSPW